MIRRLRSLPLLLILIVALPIFGNAGEEHRDPLEAALVELKGLPRLGELISIDGKSVGISGAEGRFYALSEQFLDQGSPADYRRLLHDTNVAVRVMALVCLACTDKEKFPELAKHCFRDKAKVLVFPDGCVGHEMTVGDIARQLTGDDHLLNRLSKCKEKKPPS